ncbi:hypothetical protein BSIN_4495 [Burkholderia singularis]|uniref:Uncharacterized protein n=1 Tax=Burkholderia singularis TaxID=1503053 RepID=A0A238H988_9BURK|nr:hypothetical protein BSIN_4495 [Burkholderia singularis]
MRGLAEQRERRLGERLGQRPRHVLRALQHRAAADLEPLTEARERDPPDRVDDRQMRRVLVVCERRGQRMKAHRMQRRAHAERLRERQAVYAGRDDERVGRDHVDLVRFRRARIGGVGREFDRRALRVHADRRRRAAQPELDVVGVEHLLDEFHEQRTVRGALVCEQHAARERGFGAHRRLERRARVGRERLERHAEIAHQLERGAHVVPFGALAHQVQHAAFLLEFECKTRFDIGDRFSRKLDERAQRRVLRAKRVGLAQRVEAADEAPQRAVEARLVDDAALRGAPLAHEGRTEPDVQGRRQQGAALAVGRSLRDCRVTLDDAHAMAGRAQLVSGGDAGEAAADDNDIHARFDDRWPMRPGCDDVAGRVGPAKRA